MRRAPTKTTTMALTLVLAACSTPSGPPADRIVYRTSEAPAPALEPVDPLRDAAPPAPADDIPESERIDFHERWGGQQNYVPPFDRPHRPRPAPQRAESGTSYLWFAIPLALAAGYGIYRAKRHYDDHDDCYWW